MASVKNLYVDARWSGNHGIARYSREVLARLNLPATRVEGAHPRLPGDAVQPWRLKLPRSALLYSPGYMCGPSRATQVLTVHDLIQLQVPGTAKYRLYFERVVKPVIKKAGHVLTVSETSADAIRNWLNCDDVTVHNTGNACSPAFHPDVAPSARERPYFIAVTNARPHKNLAVLIRALPLVPDVELVIVTGEVAEVERLVAESSAADRVTVLTGLSDDELARLYAGALANLFPSTVEGFGFPVVEAAGVGCPSIYFMGCAVVREVVGTSGSAVADATDESGWAFAMTAAVQERQVVGRLTQMAWPDVAARVDVAVRASLA